ncbi:MAG TPA: protein BatD [Ignavibacteria bacterium]|nr:protein BatD [Ignavibacteria bacterium]
MNKRIKNIIFTWMLLSVGLFAQSLTASLSSTKVGLNDQFQLTFTFEGKEISSVRNFSPPSLSNFYVLSGPNQSTSVQIINGVVSGSLSFSYFMRPKKTGKFTIGVASVNYQGNTYRSNPLNIEVIKGSAQPTRGSNNRGNNISNKDIGQNLFIRATANKKTVYLGEQVTITYKLYTRLSIAAQMSISKLPQYKGFWSEELNTSNNISFSTEVVNGKRYRVGVLKKAALFPSQTGKLTITPFELNVPIRIKNRSRTGNIFDSFFNDPFDQGQMINYDAKSNAVKIIVLPLPDKNVPASFKGAVGNYTMSTSINKTNIKTNETASLKVNIKGSGNIKLLGIPKIKVPNGIDKFEPKVTENVNRAGIISGFKNAEYVIIPRTPGKKEIAPIRFTFFNPAKKKYITLSSKKFVINVTPGKNIVPSTLTGVSKEDIKLLGEDIRFIKTGTNDLFKKRGIILLRYQFWLMTIIPLFLLIGILVWQKKQNKLAGDIRSLRYNKAQKVAKARLKKAKKLLHTKNELDFYSEISLVLFGYLEDKLHLSKAEFSLERAEQLLKEKGIDEKLITELKQCAEKCEFIRFAPEKGGAEAMNDMFKKSAEVIINIERNLSQKNGR